MICSTQNERQSRAIGEELTTTLKRQGVRRLGGEGEDAGLWVLQDFGDVVVHVFREDRRGFYDLDALWADAPEVKWKAASRPRSNGAPRAGRKKPVRG